MKQHPFRTLILIAIFVIDGSIAPTLAFASGKKKEERPTPPIDGKRVLTIRLPDPVEIELPDQKNFGFGNEFLARLTTHLHATGRYIVAEEGEEKVGIKTLGEDPDIVWPGTFVPAARLKITVEALSFVSGEKANRLFYGFDENLPRPATPNEFPLVSSGTTQWFLDRGYAKGEAPTDSRSGAELGKGIDLNFIFAWLKFRYETYKSRLKLKIDIDAPLSGRKETHFVTTTGEGYYWDIAAGYEGYSGGLRLARRDAMLQAWKKAINQSLSAIDRTLGELPIAGRVDSVVMIETEAPFLEPRALLGTGTGSNVKPGVVFSVVDEPELFLEATKSTESGTIARVIAGDPTRLRAGQIVLSSALPSPTASVAGGDILKLAIAPRQLASDATIKMDENKLAKPEIPEADLPVESVGKAIAQSLLEAIMLPYRLWRFEQYDQKYKSKPQDYGNSSAHKKYVQNLEGLRYAWMKQVGVTTTFRHQTEFAPLVAVIDSGIDYNHPALHARISQQPGWDFVSNDSRPFDDSYHGTQISSVIAALAPSAKLLPLKIFNPWGISSSQAIEAAVRLAIAQGAQILVMGWNTSRDSKAIRRALDMAMENGVLVITSAGDSKKAVGRNLDLFPLYPTSLGSVYDNMIQVAGLDSQGKLFSTASRSSNYGGASVDIAAPAQDILVAEPRGGYATESSTRLSTAMVAGVAAQFLAQADGKLSASELKNEILSFCRSDAALKDKIKEGRVLDLRTKTP